MTPQLRTVVPVWIAVAVLALFVAVAAPVGVHLKWLPIVMAAAVLLTFCIQLGFAQKEGLVNRVMMSFGGAIVILAVATLALGLIAIV